MWGTQPVPHPPPTQRSAQAMGLPGDLGSRSERTLAQPPGAIVQIMFSCPLPWGTQVFISHNDTLCFIAFSRGRFLMCLVLQASQSLMK